MEQRIDFDVYTQKPVFTINNFIGSTKLDIKQITRHANYLGLNQYQT